MICFYALFMLTFLLQIYSCEGVAQREKIKELWAHSSAGERTVHIREVVGSNPTAPTTQ